MSDNCIPKIIHYCWFGGNSLPELAEKCIASWKKYCPDYEIRRWDETNFDLNYNDYVREAYEAKKWAFVSDVARLYALVNYGGIYMDTDVEVLKPLDELLQYEAVSGFESESRIQTGLMASKKGQKLFVEMLHDYDESHFIRPDGTYDTTTNVTRITNICLKYGLILNNEKQTVNGFTLLPKDYLCPKDSETKEMRITENTLTIHHFDGSWLSSEQKLAAELCIKYSRFIPQKLAGYVANFIALCKVKGMKEAIHQFSLWLRRKNKGRNDCDKK